LRNKTGKRSVKKNPSGISHCDTKEENRKRVKKSQRGDRKSADQEGTGTRMPCLASMSAGRRKKEKKRAE